MRIFDTRKGSATVEASLVIPVLFMIIAGIISIAVLREEKVRENSLENIETDLHVIEDTLTNPEDILRGKWAIV